MPAIGYTLYIDEAGDEGIDRVRPMHPDGASEYFVMAGVLVRSTRVGELRSAVTAAKQDAALPTDKELHFRDLTAIEQTTVLGSLSNFKAGLICVASNKRNIQGYRNKHVERTILETKRNGRLAPQRYNWFYNNAFRYLLETASNECVRWSGPDRLRRPKIDIVFSLRKEFSYSQTRAYLEKLRTERHAPGYFNVCTISIGR